MLPLKSKRWKFRLKPYAAAVNPADKAVKILGCKFLILETMRKHLSIIALLAALPLLFSCNVKEEVSPEGPAIRFRGIMEAPAPDSETKAYVDQNLKFFWNRNDLVSIFFEKTYNRRFKYIGRTGTTAGDFERDGSDPSFFSEVDIESGYNYSIYPYQIDNACDYDGTLTVPFLENQTYVPNTNGVGASLVMVARDKAGDFFFKHVAGYVGFKLYGEGVSVSSVTFSSNNNEPIAGYPAVVFSDDDLPLLTFISNDPDNSNKMTVNYDPPIELGSSADEAKTFWLSLPPTILTKGFTITVKDSNGGVFTKSRGSSYIIERRIFKTLAALEVIPTVTVSGVQVSPASVSLSVGQTANLTATVTPASAPNKNVSWSSSNESVAVVDANGKVTAVGGGTATITATTEEGGKKATCAVTVADEVSYSLSLSPSTAQINAGGTQVYTATLTTVRNGSSTTAEVDATLSSSNTSVATVFDNTVTGDAGGEATITETYTPAGSSELTATATITVKDVISYSLALSPATAEINVGGTQAYVASLTTVKNGVSSTSTVSASLSSNNTSVATVSGDTATGVAGGNATITATYTPEGAAAVTATAALTVKDVYSYSLSLSPETAVIKAGQTQAYVATLTTVKNGVSSTSTVSATLSSSNTAVATVSGDTATGVAGGNTTITATYTPEGAAAVTATADLTVEEAVVTYSLAIAPSENITVKVGATQAFVLTLTTTTDGVAVQSDVTADATWTSSDPTIATVTAGTAKGVKNGNVTITAKYTPAGSEELSVTVALTVSDKNPNEPGDPIIVDPDEEF